MRQTTEQIFQKLLEMGLIPEDKSFESFNADFEFSQILDIIKDNPELLESVAIVKNEADARNKRILEINKNLIDMFEQQEPIVYHINALRGSFPDVHTQVKDDGDYRKFEKVNKRQHFKSHR